MRGGWLLGMMRIVTSGLLYAVDLGYGECLRGDFIINCLPPAVATCKDK
jgi:hypothetical protein